MPQQALFTVRMKKCPFSEHDPVDHPLQFYAVTKRTNELMAHAYSNLYGIETVGLRFFTVYGPWGRPDMALFKFTKISLKGNLLRFLIMVSIFETLHMFLILQMAL